MNPTTYSETYVNPFSLTGNGFNENFGMTQVAHTLMALEYFVDKPGEARQIKRWLEDWALKWGLDVYQVNEITTEDIKSERFRESTKIKWGGYEKSERKNLAGLIKWLNKGREFIFEHASEVGR